MSFSEDFIEKVRNANNVVDILSEYTQLKRSGTRLMGRCPFPGHNEKTPSFSVSEDKQIYHCFGCKRSGQIFTALQELKGLNFPEAVEYLAKRAGITMPKEFEARGPNTEEKKRRETLLKINSFAAQYFQAQLQKENLQSPVAQYVKKRRLTVELMKTFEIGYAPKGWDGLVSNLNKAGFSLALAQQLGLIRTRKEGDGQYDQFRDRLMFPIYSHKGDCVGFGGRALDNEQTPKYLNSPESEVFHKGQTFYGLNETGKFIRAEDCAIVVEGYMDFLALYGAGIKNVVATLGTALTDKHAHLLKRYTKNVIVLFDGDSAGKTAAERSLPILLREELFPKAIFLPDELDPDEFLEQKGVAALKDLMRRAPDLFSVILDEYLTDYRGTPADKVTLMNKISESLHAVVDPRLRDLYLVEISQKISVDQAWLERQLKNPPENAKTNENRNSVSENRHRVEGSVPSTKSQIENKGVSAQQITKSTTESVKQVAKVSLLGATKAELYLLNMILISESLFRFIQATDVLEVIEHAGVKELMTRADRHYRQMPNEFAKLSAFLMDQTDTPNELGLHLGEPLATMANEGLEKLATDCVRQVKERSLRSKTRALTASLKTTSTENQIQKLEQIMNIQKSKQSLRRDRES